ncbi:MAG: molybdate ABC transporter permease subunit [Bacteroidetes bacterium]|nr:MAG: molybdate ABC transporter permease subunit [Bacteroidota bacterium]
MIWEPFLLSLKLAFVTTLSLLVLARPLVYVLHMHRSVFHPAFKALVSLPLVLPPTVLGYYLLIAFQPNSWLGQLAAEVFGIQLAFSFSGLVLASVIFSLPFLVNPLLSGLEALPASYQEAAFTLGKSRWLTFWRVLLPNVKASLLVGMVMSFAHTIGEFGVILMIGGNIPGKTRVASIAIYHEVEALNYATADVYAAILLGFSFLVLLGIHAYRGSHVLDPGKAG